MKYNCSKYGFTLLELMVVVIIIAVLAAVALPQYKHAVLKSRFSTVMPMAKALADAQEVYYLGKNMYALGSDELDVTPVSAEKTTVQLSGERADSSDDYIYVAAQRSDVPDVRYLIYQKNSPKFAGNIHCEADKNNADALWLCEKGLHGTELEDVGESVQGSGYKTFLLEGTQGSDTFVLPCPENAVCNSSGEITECNSGYRLSGRACVDARNNCSRLGLHGSISGATCIQVCEDEDNPDCYKWDGGTTYTSGSCVGYQYYCAGSVFSDEAYCDGYQRSACLGSVFTHGGFCNASTVGVCDGTVIIEGSTCRTGVLGGCDGAKYDETSGCAAVEYLCPQGSPRMKWNSSTRQYEPAGWNGGYCDPQHMVSGTCPKGSPTSTSGKCWDGNGNKVACS